MVKRLIMMNQEGIPDFSQLAASMHMSERTLRRRLADEGTSYTELSAEIRKNRAIDLLQSSCFSIEQISLMLGYKDHPHFYRAFKSWSGVNPCSFRGDSASK
jgi:AraC-like DNA-binding protein